MHSTSKPGSCSDRSVDLGNWTCQFCSEEDSYGTEEVTRRLGEKQPSEMSSFA